MKWKNALLSNNRRSRLFCMLLLACLLSGGCGGGNALMLHPYRAEDTTVAYEAAADAETGRADLFAEDLCIIPVGDDKDKDGNLTGTAAMLADITDNSVTFAKNVYKKVYPASITKLVTTLVLLRKGSLSDMVTVSHEAANITEPGATKCGLREGDKIDMETLLTSFLVCSGNDAGIAIAEHVGGSVEAFADMMNDQMKELGAVDSHFVNPHGLHDDDHYTTAYDMYLVLHELLSYEKFVSIISLKEYEAVYEDKDGNEVKKSYTSTNRYLKGTEPMPDGITVIGGKTGTTSKAGSCLILYSKGDNGHEYISSIFKTDSGTALFTQMSYLLKLLKR